MADALEKGFGEKIFDEKVFETYTYQDYVSWDTKVRYELIDGVIYMMSAPSVEHQRIIGGLYIQFDRWFGNKPCEAFIAPMDVRLFPRADDADNTVVQPDLLVVCDKTKLSDGKSCRGAPDLVVEVLSPSSKQLDLHIKKDKYLKAGVQEYWIVNGANRQVQVNYRGGTESFFYTPQVYEDTAVSRIFKGFTVNLAEVWQRLG